jgi:hypothetical protein
VRVPKRHDALVHVFVHVPVHVVDNVGGQAARKEVRSECTVAPHVIRAQIARSQVLENAEGLPQLPPVLRKRTGSAEAVGARG